MRIKDIINESLSRVAYHYTNLAAAKKILSQGNFELSTALGSVEEQYAPPGYPYFLSTARTRFGGYHSTVGSGAAMFNLDGDWFNQHYKARSVDYWGDRDPAKAYGRESEAEDRVYSRKPTIPIDGVTSVHVYVSPTADENIRVFGRQVLLNAKKLDIPAYFYDDADDWRAQNTRKTADISMLTGKDMLRGYASSHRGYLMPWIEILKANDQSQLSKKADQIRYSLAYGYDKRSAAQGLANDMSNARKPNSGPDRQHVIDIISYMQKNNLRTVNDFVDAMAEKWKPKEK